MKKFRISLLWQVLIAIATGIALGQFLPVPVARIFVTFNGLFGNFLTFAIPLIIIGLIIPAISDLGKGAGRLLLVTAAIAYGSTVFSGFFTYFSGRAVFPELITESAHTAAIIDNPGNMALKPYFTVEMPAPLDIMTALLLSFCIGLGLSVVKGNTLRMAAADFRDIVSLLIAKVIIPLLPLHIFGIFLNMTVSGQVASIHLSGSTMKITACAMAIMMMSGMPVNTTDFSGFILMLGITMVAAPGVPGGAIMAALGILEGMLGFDETAQALMIALYIAMDSFGTACNVTGDGAIAVIVDRIDGKKENLMQHS